MSLKGNVLATSLKSELGDICKLTTEITPSFGNSHRPSILQSPATMVGDGRIINHAILGIIETHQPAAIHSQSDTSFRQTTAPDASSNNAITITGPKDIVGTVTSGGGRRNTATECLTDRGNRLAGKPLHFRHARSAVAGVRAVDPFTYTAIFKARSPQRVFLNSMAVTWKLSRVRVV